MNFSFGTKPAAGGGAAKPKAGGFSFGGAAKPAAPKAAGMSFEVKAAGATAAKPAGGGFGGGGGVADLPADGDDDDL